MSNRKRFLLVPVSYTVCVHWLICVSALGGVRVQSEKRGNTSVEGRTALSLPCEIHRPFLLVSPSTVGDFPNCKSSPFIVPTKSGWQHSLHCHTPHYNRPTLLQLLSVRVYLCLQNVFVTLSHPWIVSRENKQNTAKQKSFVKKYCSFFLLSFNNNSTVQKQEWTFHQNWVVPGVLNQGFSNILMLRT